MWQRRQVSAGLMAIGLGIAGTVAAPLVAQESPKPTGKAAKPAANAVGPTEAAGEKGASGRLPNNFGKLELTEAQRTKIYAVQSDYGSKIDALVRQVETLRQQRDSEIEGVLTAAQKAKLKELQAETAKKSASKKSTTEAASPATTPKD